MKDFELAKKRLNSEQMQAVESIEGPVMVLAGPGTGKTEVVALHIVEILNKTQIAPGNILALTFTEAGVLAMRKRLETFIGPAAYRVDINTFHGFANGIISQFPYYFDFDDTASRITELEQFQLLEKILDEMVNITLLKPMKSPYFRVRDIIKAIKKCKQEAISPKDLHKMAQDELRQAHGTELKKIDAERLEKRAQKNIELAQIYEKYQKALAKTNRYDFEDMILLLTRGLKENDDVRLFFQERYQYILVDEYQDTNNGQNELVFELASFFDKPNLCVVGDDKQAIYRFQGASVANILTFVKKYNPKIISLKNNYRSAPEVLEAAGALIANNQHQIASYLKISPSLSPTKKSSSVPVLCEAPNTLCEYGEIINKIKQLNNDGLPYREIAVLLRRNEDMRNFRALCYKMDLPIDGVIESDLLEEKEIQALITVLKAIENPYNEQVAFSTLMLLGVEHELDLLEQRNNAKGHLVALVVKAKNKSLMSVALKLLELHKQSLKISLSELLENIMEQSKIMASVHNNAERFARLEILSAFIAEARRYNDRNQNAKLADFLNYVDALARYKISIPVNRSFEIEDGIHLSTVHGAKGLEFDTVFMPKTDEKTWLGSKRADFIELPSEIVNLSNWQEDQIEDERRLFYVGITRAKKNLELSFSSFSDDGQSQISCQFISEIDAFVQKQKCALTVDKAEKFQETNIMPIKANLLRQQELEYIRSVVRNKPLSFTDYSTYLTCPRQYILRVVYGLQSQPTPALVYGNIVHKTLELFFKAFKGSRELPSRAELLAYVDLAAKKLENTAIVERLLDEAKEVLGRYYDSYAQNWHIPVAVELAVRNHHIMLDDIWLTGKIDRVDVLDSASNTVRIVDYKTNSTTPSRNDIEGKTKSSDGKLKKQLIFYSMLTRRDKALPYRVKEVALDFINNDRFKQEIFTVTDEEIIALEQEVKNAMKEILNTEHFDHTRADYDNGCELCAAFPEL